MVEEEDAADADEDTTITELDPPACEDALDAELAPTDEAPALDAPDPLVPPDPTEEPAALDASWDDAPAAELEPVTDVPADDASETPDDTVAEEPMAEDPIAEEPCALLPARDDDIPPDVAAEVELPVALLLAGVPLEEDVPVWSGPASLAVPGSKNVGQPSSSKGNPNTNRCDVRINRLLGQREQACAPYYAPGPRGCRHSTSTCPATAVGSINTGRTHETRGWAHVGGGVVGLHGWQQQRGRHFLVFIILFHRRQQRWGRIFRGGHLPGRRFFCGWEQRRSDVTRVQRGRVQHVPGVVGGRWFFSRGWVLVGGGGQFCGRGVFCRGRLLQWRRVLFHQPWPGVHPGRDGLQQQPGVRL